MEKLDLTRNNLKKFGITMGIVFLAITIFILARQGRIELSTSLISVAFFVLAFILIEPLKPIYISWMRLAFILSWVNTRLILCIMFYLIFAPIGLVMSLFGVDLLERKIEKNKKSYWKEKEKKEFNPLDYERLF